MLSLAWAIGQLGWVAGPAVMLLFSYTTYYTSALLADCYRSGDPSTSKRNYTYMDAVHANLSMFSPSYSSKTDNFAAEPNLADFFFLLNFNKQMVSRSRSVASSSMPISSELPLDIPLLLPLA